MVATHMEIIPSRPGLTFRALHKDTELEITPFPGMEMRVTYFTLVVNRVMYDTNTDVLHVSFTHVPRWKARKINRLDSSWEKASKKSR